MTLGSALLITALFLLVAAFVLRPLTTGAGVYLTAAERRLSELLAARDHTLSSLADLEMDNMLEKIPSEDYVSQRAELLQEGAEILRQIDALADEGLGEATSHLASHTGMMDADAELEAAVARMRTRGDKSVGGFCPQCGNLVVASDRFCSRCGTTLTVEETQA